jgi:hypothetical protein
VTAVRGKRGKLVHAWTPVGSRRDLAPEDVPSLLCGKRLKGAVITDEHVDCPICVDVLFNGN